jgi:hypothetical protein
MLSPKGKDAVMKLFRLLFVLLFCFVVVGLFRGWFNFSSSDNDAEKDKVNFNVSLDKAKLKEDVGKAEKKVAEKIKKLAGKENTQEKK